MHGTGPISVGIEVVSHSMFSHVALVSDPAKHQIIEAQWGRTVGYQSLGFYANSCLITRLPSLTDTQRNQIVEFAHSQFGAVYDLNALIAEAERYLFGRPMTPEERGQYICSSLVAKSYESVGMPLSDQPIASPGDLYDDKALVVIGRC